MSESSFIECLLLEVFLPNRFLIFAAHETRSKRMGAALHKTEPVADSSSDEETESSKQPAPVTRSKTSKGKNPAASETSHAAADGETDSIGQRVRRIHVDRRNPSSKTVASGSTTISKAVSTSVVLPSTTTVKSKKEKKFVISKTVAATSKGGKLATLTTKEGKPITDTAAADPLGAAATQTMAQNNTNRAAATDPGKL